MAVGEEFNKTAAYNDDWVQKALPCYGEVFAIILELLPTINDEQMTVLDLGSGTGLFSKHVLPRLPKAHFVLWDVAEEMLNVAKERFAEHSDQYEYVVDDYRRLDRIGKLMPEARRGDGDPLDICVVSERPIARAELILNARVVGGLPMLDGGEADDKIIAVLENDPFWSHVSDLPDL